LPKKPPPAEPEWEHAGGDGSSYQSDFEWPFLAESDCQNSTPSERAHNPKNPRYLSLINYSKQFWVFSGVSGAFIASIQDKWRSDVVLGAPGESKNGTSFAIDLDNR
jgi:hypothetical protein